MIFRAFVYQKTILLYFFTILLIAFSLTLAPKLGCSSGPLPQLSDTSTTAKACNRCSGTGQCQVCWGTGEDGHGAACYICSGSTTCYFCSGTGKW